MSGEVGILFSAPMVRALLAGRKSQTRRLSQRWLRVKAGDRLWVRETWAPGDRWARLTGVEMEPPETIRYRADNACRRFYCDPDGFDEVDTAGWSDPKTWRPSIHMFRWASRITLEATEDARLERLQDISDEDAVAEGIWSGINEWVKPEDRKPGDAVYLYRDLWDTINGDGSWASNPEVVRLAFKVVPA